MLGREKNRHANNERIESVPIKSDCIGDCGFHKWERLSNGLWSTKQEYQVREGLVTVPEVTWDQENESQRQTGTAKQRRMNNKRLRSVFCEFSQSNGVESI